MWCVNRCAKVCTSCQLCIYSSHCAKKNRFYDDAGLWPICAPHTHTYAIAIPFAILCKYLHKLIVKNHMALCDCLACEAICSLFAWLWFVEEINVTNYVTRVLVFPAHVSAVKVDPKVERRRLIGKV